MIWERKNHGPAGFELSGIGFVLICVGGIMVGVPIIFGLAVVSTYLSPLELMAAIAATGAAILGGVFWSYLRNMRRLRVEMVRDQLNQSMGR